MTTNSKISYNPFLNITPDDWRKLGTADQRAQWAQEHPLAWILEYRPTILLPGLGYQEFNPYPFQREFLCCRDQYRIINKPRQCGISTTVAAEVAWEFDCVPGAQIMIVSKDLDAAMNFLIYVVDILKSAHQNNPAHPKLLKQTQTTLTNANGARVKSLAASKEAGRSFSPTHFVFDEAAFTIYDQDIWQAASSALAKTRGRATMISTPKGRMNLFAEIMLQDQAEPDGSGGVIPAHKGFRAFDYKWWHVPDYNPYYDELMAAKNERERQAAIEKARSGEWYRAIRPTKSTLQWKQEFEGEFDANVGAVFSRRQIERVFWRNWLTQKRDPEGIVTEWWSEGYKDGRIYEVGIDLGRKNDPTIVWTYDVTDFDPHDRDENGFFRSPAPLVDYKYIEPGTASWKEIKEMITKHLESWKASASHDGTGVGDVFDGDLEGLSEAFYFTAKEKENIVKRIQHAFDYGAVRIPKIARVYREHQGYEWDDKNIKQDTVMAHGLALQRFYDGEEMMFTGFARFDLGKKEMAEV